MTVYHGMKTSVWKTILTKWSISFNQKNSLITDMNFIKQMLLSAWETIKHYEPELNWSRHKINKVKRIKYSTESQEKHNCKLYNYKSLILKKRDKTRCKIETLYSDKWNYIYVSYMY